MIDQKIIEQVRMLLIEDFNFHDSIDYSLKFENLATNNPYQRATLKVILTNTMNRFDIHLMEGKLKEVYPKVLVE